MSAVPTVINTAFAVFVVWIMVRSYWQRRIDGKFGCSRFGGRGGHITIRHDGRTALVDFELAAKDIDLIIYDSYLRWIGTNQKDLTEDDRAALLAKLVAWCKARKYKIELESNHVA
ncbi:MAG: hypothetical protein HY306_07990 [Nitrosomonadales bacterium]|nr:hypothetical protein [Nitrosomonadales bacterium]